MAGWILLPPESRAGFLGAYGPIEPLTWRLARFRALNHTANVLHYAHQTSNGDLLRESVLALRWLSHA